MSASAFEPSNLEAWLREYYRTIFPFKSYTKWLCYGEKPSEKFALREFAFILEGDTHLRYRSFQNEADFEKDLIKMAPHKLDLGAIYSHPPKENKKHSDFKPVEREFVLDIDLTDYGNVRTCCTKATVCAKCWKFIALAVNILDKILEEDFGFVARMWVFSGRRGVHCWIGDVQARQLNNSQRQAVAEYLSLFSGDKMNVNFGGKKVRSQILHPMVNFAYKCALQSELFQSLLFEQQWLSDSRLDFLLQQIEDEEVVGQITKSFKLKDSERWDYLLKKFDEETRVAHNAKTGASIDPPPATCENFLKWFVLYHCYPRLDVNVSTGMNHLLKSPFCVHPATGNIAVPLNPKKIHEFDVTQAPRVDQLLKQLRENGQNSAENRRILGYNHTSLKDYVHNFNMFIMKALANAEEERAKQKDLDIKPPEIDSPLRSRTVN
ncbi:unnamed protein product, partial [Mesorhabditis belari]|uniref:DNA primase n=1 Tax=Mesorhabditis belari TaxID=2138241 RepID=A0AAF3F1U3_9BILA